MLDGMIELLETDKSKDVRVAVVQSLPLYDATMPVLLDCIRDEHPLVRKAVLQRLKAISIRLIRYAVLQSACKLKKLVCRQLS